MKQESKPEEPKIPTKQWVPAPNTLIGEEKNPLQTRSRPQSRQSEESDWIGPPIQPRISKTALTNVLVAEEANPQKQRIRSKSRQNEGNVDLYRKH